MGTKTVFAPGHWVKLNYSGSNYITPVSESRVCADSSVQYRLAPGSICLGWFSESLVSDIPQPKFNVGEKVEYGSLVRSIVGIFWSNVSDGWLYQIGGDMAVCEAKLQPHLTYKFKIDDYARTPAGNKVQIASRSFGNYTKTVAYGVNQMWVLTYLTHHP